MTVKPPRVIVVMGVSGVGKTTFGTALALALGYRFEDADAYHPPANVAKMSSGVPLDDADRQPWLESLAELIARSLAPAAEAPGLVLACSALRARYRETLRLLPGDAALVHLIAPRDVLTDRLESRAGHFMKATLLDSQLAALEAPDDALTLDGTKTVDALVSETRRALFAERP
jgi:gluconokinase